MTHDHVEVSTIAAGLSYGQYFSQYDMREIAANNRDEAQTKHSYLVGVNDQHAAMQVHLNHTEYNNTDYTTGHTQRHLAWIKYMTRRGWPVTMTIYMNFYLFYGDTSPNAGDPLYDHIVSVIRVESNFDDDEYHDSDIITFSDHGLWDPSPQKGPRYYFSYEFSEFQGLGFIWWEEQKHAFILISFLLFFLFFSFRL